MTTFDWAAVLDPVMDGENIGANLAHAAMAEIMAGRAETSQIAAFIVALRMKGETVAEMTGLVEAMREQAITVDIGETVVDTAGTGGDRSGTFNVSTTAALIAAGAGAKVAKHGNRAASSQTGSADLLEALGVAIDLEPEATASMVRDVGFGFFFAPRYHPAMRFAGPVRSQLGVRTVFNFLGPLANPAGATRQVIGVSDPAMAERMIGVLHALGSEAAFVVHGEDGLDEITTTAPTFIYRLLNGEITHAEFTPEDFGVPRSQPDALRGGDARTNARITESVLAGDAGPARDISVVNAAAAIVSAGLAGGFAEGVERASAAVDSGAAASVLQAVRERSAELAGNP